MPSEYIVGLRSVHEIIRATSKTGLTLCVSFIQHGTSDDGYEYEVVCPYCARTLSRFTEDPAVELTQIDVFRACRSAQLTHVGTCTASGHTLKVQKAKAPLGVETKRSIV